MTRPGRVHLDATPTAGALRAALCGWIGVATTHDASLATCRACLARLRGEQPKAQPPGGRFMDARAVARAVARELHIDLRLGGVEDLAPAAPPPPLLTPALWERSCRGGEFRCRDCELCAWDTEVERWAFASAWTRRHGDAQNGRARWRTVSAALRALVEYEQAGRHRSSAQGGMLERLARQDHERRPWKLGKEHRDADDIVHVQRALERAYDDSHRLPRASCAAVLLERTPGVLPELTPYATLTARYGLSLGDLQSIVRRGRRAIEEDLLARGLVEPARGREPRAASSAWKAADAF